MGGITDSQISGYPENLRTDPNVEKMRLWEMIIVDHREGNNTEQE
jgi:hypothetical protein